METSENEIRYADRLHSRTHTRVQIVTSITQLYKCSARLPTWLPCTHTHTHANTRARSRPSVSTSCQPTTTHPYPPTDPHASPTPAMLIWVGGSSGAGGGDGWVGAGRVWAGGPMVLVAWRRSRACWSWVWVAVLHVVAWQWALMMTACWRWRSCCGGGRVGWYIYTCACTINQ